MAAHVTIRLATITDAPSIAEVHLRSWMTAYRGILADAFLDGLMDGFADRVRRWEGILSSPEPPGAATFVSELPGIGVVGFASSGASRMHDPRFTGELYSIYILGDHRGHGIGRRLLSRSVAHLRSLQLESLHLWVIEGNPSLRFYEAMGGGVIPGWTKELVIGGTSVSEIACGWQRLPEEEELRSCARHPRERTA